MEIQFFFRKTGATRPAPLFHYEIHHFRLASYRRTVPIRIQIIIQFRLASDMKTRHWNQLASGTV